MLTLNDFIAAYYGSCLGHIMLVIYLFAIVDEHVTWKQAAGRLPALLLSPLMVTGISALFSDRMTVLLLGSLSNLFCCTFWVKWAWKIPLWKAFSYICMAGVMQVLNSSLRLYKFLADVLSVEWLVSTAEIAGGMLLALGAAFFLRKTGFGVLFRSLLEEAGRMGWDPCII